jgi:hypothetical protein
MNPSSHDRESLKVDHKSDHTAKGAIITRDYRVVVLGIDGGRTEVSRHRSFIAAERVRLSFPTLEACEIRIESIPAGSLKLGH